MQRSPFGNLVITKKCITSDIVLMEAALAMIVSAELNNKIPNPGIDKGWFTRLIGITTKNDVVDLNSNYRSILIKSTRVFGTRFSFQIPSRRYFLVSNHDDLDLIVTQIDVEIAEAALVKAGEKGIGEATRQLLMPHGFLHDVLKFIGSF